MAGTFPPIAIGSVLLAVLITSLIAAYRIRTYALTEYGLIIHEFDPWFNFRATQYLADNGLDKFFKWFDYMSWYPLGRPVGTTIYPGMQMTAVAIWKVLAWIEATFGQAVSMSLNDICCYIPVWFGVSATFFLGLLGYECSGSATAAVAAAAIMAVIPAHTMRSVGGGYDNESIAMTAMCATFWLWTRSLRSAESWRWSPLCGLSYVYMVAAWGGYVFVLNMIAVHTLVLIATGNFSPNLHKAYTLFYVVGTLGALQIPVVGWTPLKSLEQLGAFGVLVLLQLIVVAERQRAARPPDTIRPSVIPFLGGWDKESILIHARIFGTVGVVAVALCSVLLQTGYFGPISSRVRSLFVPHTRTGNPLVDSVAEHQPASQQAYFSYLYSVCYIAPIGFFMSFRNITPAKLFLISYGVIAYFFASKMMRLIILLGPVASIFGGIFVGFLVEWSLQQLFVVSLTVFRPSEEEEEEGAPEQAPQAAKAKAKGADQQGRAKGAAGAGPKDPTKGVAKKAAKAKPRKGSLAEFVQTTEESFFEVYELPHVRIARVVIAALVLLQGRSMVSDFHHYSQQLARQFSQPVILYKGRLQDGTTVVVDDYRQAYHWLRDFTPEDARVLSWWDYGYQITGIGNRTTLADGNTWNHEHIATIALMLTSPEKEAHALVKHLADYVLIWTGGGGDDLAKSPHMARIGNSVYPHLCPEDPTCQHFGFAGNKPTKLMARSLLYRLHSADYEPGVTVDRERFEEVFVSKHRKVRIWKVLGVSAESKAWAADPAHRKCDAPGSWYCEGDYPPLFYERFKKKGYQRRNFAQLEDFNTKKNAQEREAAERYQKEYHERMSGAKRATGEGVRLKPP